MITEEKSSIRHAAQTYEVDRITLKRYLDKRKLGYKITSAAKRVSTTQEEKLVADHIRALDNCFHGLSKDKCRMLAFDYAKANNISTPANWIKDGMAGKLPDRILHSFTLIQILKFSPEFVRSTQVFQLFTY